MVVIRSGDAYFEYRPGEVGPRLISDNKLREILDNVAKHRKTTRANVFSDLSTSGRGYYDACETVRYPRPFDMC